LGFQLIAIAPDAPDNLQKTATKNRLSFALVGDSQFAAIDAFGIAWGKEGKSPLPTPAVYVVGTDGLVHFQYVHPTYSVRLHPDILLAVLRVASAKKE